MAYSQKYTIVQFLEPIEEPQIFNMDSWPLHITLADVFAVDLSESLVTQLRDLLASGENMVVEAGTEDLLGDDDHAVKVRLVQNTPELQSLHDRIIDFLEANEAVFNSPQFTRNGFLPHVTIQGERKPTQGQQLDIKQLSLIDMFVDGDWRRRKILANFKLGQ